MTSKYSIKIDFDKTLMENPERVFEAMSFYVRGFNGLYEAFIKGFDEELIIESGLEETREGSLIADITHKITDKKSFLIYSESGMVFLKDWKNPYQLLDK